MPKPSSGSSAGLPPQPSEAVAVGKRRRSETTEPWPQAGARDVELVSTMPGVACPLDA